MDSPCVLWTGRVRADGYGTIGKDLAHVRAWRLVHGLVPEGLTLDHLCHDPLICQLGVECPHRRCVNLEHLAAIPAQENRKRTAPRGWSVTHCPEGHEYSEENTLWSGGGRHCRACRLIQQTAIRAEQKLARCTALGHTRSEAVASNGARYCTVCASLRAAASAEARTGRAKGRDPERAAVAREAWLVKKREAACRAKGHVRAHAVQPSGRQHCEICTSMTGRPRKSNVTVSSTPRRLV